MKPIRLTMQAFGSYGEKAVIDFTAPNQKLFLITGDTGAGKTTIFDAMVYALYDQVSSSKTDKKGGLDLQSHFANRYVTPFVEFEFSELHNGQEDTYTIYRSPEHYSKKNATTTKKKVRLVMPDGKDFPSNNAKEINAKIMEILGLTKEQFMQVGMIAQGEFMQMLRSKSDEKKAIFRKLFGTELFERIIAELNERNKSAQQELKELLLDCQKRVEDIRLPKDLPEGSPLPALKAKLADKKEKPNIVDLEDLARELKLLTAEQQKQLEEINAACKATASQRDEINALAAKAQELAKAYGQLDKVLAQEKDCQGQQAQQEKNSQLAQGIMAAYEIKASHDRLADKEKLIRDTQKQQADQETQLPELKKAAAAARNAEKAAHEKDKAALSALTATKTRVESALQYFAEAEAAQKELAAARNKLAAAQESHTRAREAQAAYSAQVNTWQKQAQGLAAVKGEQAQYKSRQEKVEAWEKKRQELLTLKKKATAAAQKAKKCQENYLAQKANYEEQQQIYTKAQQHFLDAQAGILAQELRPGQPCPVCGSLQHPAPHLIAEQDKPLERSELEAMRENVRQLEKAQAEAAATAQEANTSLANLEEQLRHQQEEFFQDLQHNAHMEIPSEDPLPAIQLSLQKWQKQIEAKLRELAAKEQELDTIQKNLSQSGEKVKQLQENCDSAALLLQKAQGKAQALQEKIKTLQEQQAYPDSQAARAELAKAEQTRGKAQQEFAQAQEDSRKAQSLHQQAETIIKDCQNKLPGLQAEKAVLEQDYQALCQAKELSPAAWQSLAAGFTLDEARKMQAAYQKYKEDAKALQGQKASLQATIGQQPRPDLEKLTARQQKIDGLYQEQHARQQLLRDMLLPNENTAHYLEKHLAARASKLGTAAVLDNLYKRLSGNTSGKHLDIETFVQRHYLSAILKAANLRFREMSAGQFELRLLPMEAAEKGVHGANKGLALSVYSTITGQERDIKTLSGGESFMAALSLALGLSDQIQASTSAINLDIMFIDEGFGSLDDHARDQSIRVLKRLSGGNKLIGIISHVTELKQEMDNQLIVTKDEHGSHAQWQIS